MGLSLSPTALAFKKRAADAGFALDDFQCNRFEIYRRLIKEWNQKIDITKITEDREIDNKHFMDSLSLFRLMDRKKPYKLVDIGTGGGFPGIVLAILNPALEMTLLDSLNKRVEFLKVVIKELGLRKVWAVHGRAEEVFRQKEYRDGFDVAVSRAVAPLPTLLEYCLPAVRVGGVFYAMKGPAAEEELAQSQKATQSLGGKLGRVDSFLWTEEQYQRTILEFQKVSPTPARYPRGQGKPRKAPLS